MQPESSHGARSRKRVAENRYRLHLKPVLGELRLGDIHAQRVAEIIRSMRDRGYAESTIHNTLVVLRGLFRIANHRGLVSRSPFDGLDPAELPRADVGNHGR